MPNTQHSLSERFSRHLGDRHPDCLCKPLLLACSGGADSLALLELLLDIELEPALAHVVHRPGEQASEAAATLVAELAAELGLQHLRIELEPQAGTGGSLESRWRDQRYAALESARQALGAELILTAHHADDLAEGVLTRLLRGGGMRSLAGIHASHGRLRRPLLAFSRSELRAWLRLRGRTFHEDPSNAERRHLRNRVRLDLMPPLLAAEPALGDHLRELAQQIADAEDALTAGFDSSWKLDPHSPRGGVPIATLEGLPRALRRRWLLGQCNDLGLEPPSRAHLRLFDELLAGQHQAITLRQRYRLRRHRDRLWLEPESELPRLEIELTGSGPWPWGFGGYSFQRCDSGVPGLWRAPMPAAATMRCSRPGDRLMDGSLLRPQLNRWLPAHLAAAWPLLAQDATILWLPGLAVGPEPGTAPGSLVEVHRR